MHVLDGADSILHADEQLLERALGNAVDNAVRYGAGDITLSAREQDAAVVLAVHDEGAGMLPDFLPHAAERFRQEDPSRSGAGAGLGLSLIDAIVTAHGGQLRICAGGHHHTRPSPHPELAKVPCAQPETGTTISLLLVALADARPR